MIINFFKYNYLNIFATCLVARIVVGGVMAAPRLCAVVAVLYAFWILTVWVKGFIRCSTKRNLAQDHSGIEGSTTPLQTRQTQ